MAKIRLSEVNSYVRSIYDQVDLSGLVNTHAATIRAWFIANMSKIGRYSNRDFERFGNLYSTSGDPEQQGRQDGWVSVTEEVTDIDNVTYGTGIVYIHGEMEVPGQGNLIKNSGFSSQDANGGEKFESVVGARDGALLFSDAGPLSGIEWEFEQTTTATYAYTQIVESVSGINVQPSTSTPSASATTPSEFNDSSLYHLDNERNNYPMIIINSAAPESIDRLLRDNIDGQTGMYDGSMPSVSMDSFGPKKGMAVSEGDRKKILDYISPTNGNS